MKRFLPLGSLLLVAGCLGPAMDEDWDSLFEDEPRYRIVVERVEFSPTKPGGEPWDVADGRPDPCILIGNEWDWYGDMTPIAWDEFSYEWNYVTYADYSVEELASISLMINDEDPEGENDGDGQPTPTPTAEPTATANPTPTPDPTPTPEPTPTPPDNGLSCDKIEGSQIGVEGVTLQVGTKLVTIHDWVLKAGETNEYHGFSWDQTGTVDIRVKAGTQSYIASGGSWLHPGAGTNAAAISHVEVCEDTDDQLHQSMISLVPDHEDGQTFDIDLGAGKGVERVVIRVERSEGW